MPLLEAHRLHKRFGQQIVLDDVSFDVETGELVGIIGPNGAGKTTFFNVLTGRYRPERGNVTFDGRDITGASPASIARAGISRSFQLMNLFDSYSALDNVIVAIEHDMPFLFRIADRISVIQWGQVIAQGTPAELRADPWVARSNLGAVAA